jgi:hypothetical protein
LGGAGRSRGEALAERVRVGLSALKARAGAGADRLKETSEELLRPQLLRQALAARERGNLEAAFWLLREELALRPHDEHAVRTFWDVAAACGRAQAAVESMTRLVHQQASAGRRDVATDCWLALVREVPDAVVDAASLARIVPELKARVEQAEDEMAREEARACLLRALRHSVDPRGGGLRPGLALRLFEEARTVDSETARRAAQVALGSSELHEAKRARVEALLEALERGGHADEVGARRADESAGAAGPASEALRVTEAAFVEIAEQGLVMRELASDRRARLDFRSIEAVAVAEVAGLAAHPVLVIDLVLKPSAAGRRARHVLRMRGDAFNPAALAPGPDAGEALRSFLAELLGRTRAVPLPEPDSALGIRPRGFASLADYEREVLGHLAR